jgi:Flp pilus assembly protein TadB
MGQFFKTYQTLVVGLLGFLGVIATMLWNAHLQRKQEERRERREASALRTALIEELKQQREALQYTADSLAAAQASTQDGTHGSLIPLERYDAVFRGSLERLGLLKRRGIA